MATPPVEAPAPAAHAAEPEQRLTSTPAGQAAGLAVQALSRAARSFVLYDPQNSLVKQMLELFRDKTLQAAALTGELALDFGPYDVSLHGEVVYSDHDREKSLAFKLFRDGIRRLTIRSTAGADELFRLLEIVALRYTAMRQQEEDAVTLMRKAEFKAIELIAVEGFSPAEEHPEVDVAPEFFRGPKVEIPPDFDTPLPRLNAPGRVSFVEVPSEVMNALVEQEAEHAWASNAVALGKDLLREAARAGWPEPREDLVHYFVELREAMLADSAFGPLKALLGMLETEHATRAHQELVKGLADPRTIDVILDAIPGEEAKVPPELVALLPFLSGGTALERLLVEKDERRSGLLLELVLASGQQSADDIVKKLPGLELKLVRAMAKGLAARSPKLALEVGRLLLAQPDPAVKAEGLEALAASPGEGVTTALLQHLDSPAPELRLKALELAERRADPAAAPRLVQVLENKDRPLPEVEALGQALARLSPGVAAKHFLAWAHPKIPTGGRITGQQKRLQWAAVAGLAVFGGAVAEKQLLAVMQGADEALKRHCTAALARLKKGAPAHG